MARVFVTREILGAGLELLRGAGHEVTVSKKDGVLTRDELLAALKENQYEALITMLSEKVDGELFAAAPSVRMVANYAVGFDNIDVAAAKEHGVVVTNTPGVLTDAVAEHTISLMFALAKRIPEADRFTRAGKYDGWGPLLLLGSELRGKTLGLIGLGRIGVRVANIAAAMGMNILYCDIRRDDTCEAQTGATFVEHVEALLPQADIVSIHVPLVESTKHLINSEKLSLMKPQSLLVNTSRGPVVDEAALVRALQEKRIRGAALDVFEYEPQLADGLAALDNVVLTPHIASATEEARSAMSALAGQSIVDFFSGKEPLNRVA